MHRKQSSACLFRSVLSCYSYFLTPCLCLSYRSCLVLAVVLKVTFVISTFDLAMLAECLRKDSPNKLYLPKLIGENQLNDLELDGPITLRILDGIARDFIEGKWWMWWKTVKCGDLISNCCPRNPHGKASNEKRREVISRLKKQKKKHIIEV